jgi:hypothetical protein
MPPLSLSQLYESYLQLRGQLERQDISYQQFVDGVRQLQAQDAAGRWWMIDPQTGHYLTYTASGWTEATPGANQPVAPQQPAGAVIEAQAPAVSPGQHPSMAATSSSQPASVAQSHAPHRGGCLTSPILTALLSFGTALLWFAYSSLSPSSEGSDLLTPLLIAGTPLVLRLLQKHIDKILNPLYELINLVPRPLLVGAAFALPLVLGGIMTRAGGSGYQALRRSTVLSVVSGYILTRRPEAGL